ncbi:DoxX family protein [Chitinophaga sp. Cy-1792]|uniref:DoxX family protein n=1 Tax=Chitinophaga sp. Cy-1792 TaxID=2608339 RepID=UPI0014212EDE|nr:DoxX family protein [Chitinophaga sp. Cy-1792]NIG56623.1 DoxX family protein [Chitinophaga sp. Cy-1792]
MKINQDIATLLLRLGLSGSLLSAVASRLGLWGQRSSGWQGFVKYTAEVNSFLPNTWAPALAIGATILETAFGIMLLAGFKIPYAAIGTAALTFLFAVAMSISGSVKDPLDYSVFAFSAGALLLYTMPAGRWSLDSLFHL